jgi:hypothetical protein
MVLRGTSVARYVLGRVREHLAPHDTSRGMRRLENGGSDNGRPVQVPEVRQDLLQSRGVLWAADEENLNSCRPGLIIRTPTATRPKSEQGWSGTACHDPAGPAMDGLRPIRAEERQAGDCPPSGERGSASPLDPRHNPRAERALATLAASGRRIMDPTGKAFSLSATLFPVRSDGTGPRVIMRLASRGFVATRIPRDSTVRGERGDVIRGDASVCGRGRVRR